MSIIWLSPDDLPKALGGKARPVAKPGDVVLEEDGTLVIADLDGLAKKKTKRDVMAHLAERCQESGTELVGLHGGTEQAWFDLEDCLRWGIELISDIAYVLPTEENDGYHELARIERVEHEFVTLLGTSSGDRLRRELTTALVEMRRETGGPVWTDAVPNQTDKQPGSHQYQWLKTAEGWYFDEGKDSKDEEFPLPSILDLLRTPNSSYTQRRLESTREVAGGSWAAEHPLPPPLLLLGETGTGKSLTARLIHRHLFGDDAKDRPFVHLAAPQLTPKNYQNDMYGFTAYRYTDVGTGAGYALRSGFGTLFIDEIGDMPLEVQESILVFLDTRTADVVGFGEVFVPVQIIAATNRDVWSLARSGRFRHDLLRRFRRVVELEPLRSRFRSGSDEVLRLARYVLGNPHKNPDVDRGLRKGEPSVVGIEQAAIDCLRKHPFGGNFREFEDVLASAVASARRLRSTVIREWDIRQNLQPPAEPPSEDVIRTNLNLEELQGAVAKQGPIPVESATDLAARIGRPVIETASGHRAIVADGLLWAESPPPVVSTPGTERQLKFQISANAAEALSKAAELGRFELGDTAEQQVCDSYYDTANRSIWRNGYTLRKRQEAGEHSGGAVQLSLQRHAEPVEAYFERVTLRSGAVDSPRVQEVLKTAEPRFVGLAMALSRGQDLDEVVKIEQHRTRRPILIDNRCIATLSVDKVIRSDQEEMWFAEILFPVEGGTADAGADIVAELCEALLGYDGVEGAEATKYVHVLRTPASWNTT